MPDSQTSDYFMKNVSSFRILKGLRSGMVVSSAASQQQGSRSESQLGPFCVEFAWIVSGYSGFLSDMHVR